MGTVKIKKVMAEVIPGEVKSMTEAEIKAATDTRWYPGKRELTAKEESQRSSDCGKVKYGGVVPLRMQEVLDKERRANWIPPVEVDRMDAWKPVLTPVAQDVIDESVKEVSVFMETISRPDREVIVKKLVQRVMRKLASADVELVEKCIWRLLFDLQKEQGVVNRDKIFNVLPK